MEQPSQKILRLAYNKWDTIYRELAPELDGAIKASKNASGNHVACPKHASDDGFRLFDDWKENGGGICSTCGAKKDGIRMLAWLKNESYTNTLKVLFELLEDNVIPEYVPTARELEQDRAKRKEKSLRAASNIRRVWSQTIPVTDPRAEPARLYLASRGLAGVYDNASVVRYHPALFYRDKQVGKLFLPALVFKVVDGQGRATTLHRIYIDQHGRKADVSKPKRLMPYPKHWRTLTGGCIRLFEAGSVLGIAEGVETSLAVYVATGMPMWATISAGLMESVQIPDHVERLWAWQDKDKNGRGETAAITACESMWSQGREAGAWCPGLSYDPGQKSVDWLDVFNRVGRSGFPGRAELAMDTDMVAHG